MSSMTVIKEIREAGVVAVIRADTKEKGKKLINAVLKGGIRVIEITMTVPGSIELIRDIAETYKGKAVIGAGTVLDQETARVCILAGAEFIVSPALNAETIKLCNRYDIPAIPGVMTVSEAVEALTYGAKVIKIFPAGLYGPAVIKSFKGPLPQASFMPTGGVTIENAKEWIQAGAVAIGTGSDLTRGAQTGNYARVKETAARFVQEVALARNTQQ